MIIPYALTILGVVAFFVAIGFEWKRQNREWRQDDDIDNFDFWIDD